MHVFDRSSRTRRGSSLVGAAVALSPAFAAVVSAAPLTFAVIGDYGRAPQYSPGGSDPGEQYVASMVNSWSPTFVATVGDNNYGNDGADGNYTNATVIHNNIDAYYGSYITGSTSTNHFFPVLGNADWGEETGTGSATSDAWYESHFSGLPTNGNGVDHRYYTVTQGTSAAGRPLVQLFMLDDDSHDPNFNTTSAAAAANSVEGQWLKSSLAASNAVYKIVVTHHAPYTSGDAGSTNYTELPYKTWGASAVLSGHAHIFERLSEPDPGQSNTSANDIPYFVDGLGGDSIQGFGSTIAGSQSRYENSHGAIEAVASDTQLTFQFWSVDDAGTNPTGQPAGQAYTLGDTYTINAPVPEPTSFVLIGLGGVGALIRRRRSATL